MTNAAQSPIRINDPETVRLWRVYERQAARAKLQYECWPISLGRAGPRNPCRRKCGRRTESVSGICRHCTKAARR